MIVDLIIALVCIGIGSAFSLLYLKMRSKNVASSIIKDAKTEAEQIKKEIKFTRQKKNFWN